MTKGARLQDLVEQGGWYSLLLYSALLPFRFFEPLRLTTPRGMLLTVLAISLVVKAVGKQWRRSPLDLPLIALGASAILSSLLSVNTAYSLHSLKREMLPFLLLFWGTWNLAHSPHRRRQLTWTLVISCLLVVMLGMLCGRYEGTRFKGVFTYPTQLGKYMDLMLPLLAGVALAQGYPALLKAGVTILLLFSGATVVLSQTRTSIVLMALTLGTMAALLRKRAAVILLALFILVPLYLYLSSPRIRARVNPLLTHPLATLKGDPAMKQRYTLYREALEMIKTRPLTGWGYGRHITRKIRDGKEVGALAVFWHSHNLLLEVTLQCGMVGLGALLWMLVVMLRCAIPSLRRAIGDNDPELLGYLLGLLAIGVHSMLSVPQWGTTLLMAVFTAMAILPEEAEVGH